jgi:hypothetical protein
MPECPGVFSTSPQSRVSPHAWRRWECGCGVTAHAMTSTPAGPKRFRVRQLRMLSGDFRTATKSWVAPLSFLNFTMFVPPAGRTVNLVAICFLPAAIDHPGINAKPTHEHAPVLGVAGTSYPLQFWRHRSLPIALPVTVSQSRRIENIRQLVGRQLRRCVEAAPSSLPAANLAPKRNGGEGHGRPPGFQLIKPACFCTPHPWPILRRLVGCAVARQSSGARRVRFCAVIPSRRQSSS